MGYDVVFFDEVGMEYVESDDENGALGGSELEVTILASELSKHGFRVIVENRNRLQADDVSTSGAVYRKIGSHRPIETHTLIVMRYSRVPKHIHYKKLILWLHDIPGKNGDAGYPGIDPNPDAKLVCVSRWHASLFPDTLPIRVIPNMLPASNYEMAAETKVPGRFHYASGAMKGLDETLTLWRKFYPHIKALRERPELHVFTPAWSAVGTEELDSGIVLRGPVTPSRRFLKEMSQSEGMFYVNKLPENFCISAAQTELFGGRVHMLCINPYFGDAEGGVRDTLSNPEWITTDADEFEKKFFAALESAPKVTARSPGFHPDVLMPTWIDLIS